MKKDLLTKQQELAEKHLDLFLLMNQWVKNYHQGKKLSSFFQENGYHKVAIYGMSYVGERLYEELCDSDISVEYAIENNRTLIGKSLPIYGLNEELPYTDIIVVTAISYYNEIKKALCEKAAYPVVSLEDIIYEL